MFVTTNLSIDCLHIFTVHIVTLIFTLNHYSNMITVKQIHLQSPILSCLIVLGQDAEAHSPSKLIFRRGSNIVYQKKEKNIYIYVYSISK